MAVLSAVCGLLLVGLVVFAVLLLRSPGQDPAVLESGHAEPRDAVRAAMERER